MHARYPAHIVLPYLHLRRLRNVVAGAFCLACGLTIQPYIEMTVKAVAPSGIAMLGYHHFWSACPGEELIHPAHHRPGIMPDGEQASTCRWHALRLRLAQVAPHRFFDIVPIDGEIDLELVGAVLEASGIVIRDAPLPQRRRQGGVEVFGTIEICNRWRNVPELKGDHAPLDVDRGVVRVRLEASRQTLHFAVQA